jgi:hypothetical protein
MILVDIGLIAQKQNCWQASCSISAAISYKSMSKRVNSRQFKADWDGSGSLSNGEARRVQRLLINRVPEPVTGPFESFMNNFRRQLIKSIHGVPIFKPSLYCDPLRRIGVSGHLGETILFEPNL